MRFISELGDILLRKARKVYVRLYSRLIPDQEVEVRCWFVS
jgi:hypothetical protein